jgi:sugar/nucleoside kinase (ribokinase family)
MLKSTPLEPIDYLIVGHLTKDLTQQGARLGGTAAYASLTAHVLGVRVGVVTSWSEELPLGPLEALRINNFLSDTTTTFENIYTKKGRVQIVRDIAPGLDYYNIPEPWRTAPIVHLGPIAQEVEPGLIRYFPSALIGLTPQGWLRAWDKDGKVYPSEWPEAAFMLEQAGAVALSIEDVGGDESRIEELAASSRILVVTEAYQGSRVFWNGDVRRFRPPPVTEVDATGAGDIFAAAFFIRLHATRDPWEAARFATALSAISVTRPGLDGVPTMDEVREIMVEVL